MIKIIEGEGLRESKKVLEDLVSIKQETLSIGFLWFIR